MRSVILVVLLLAACASPQLPAQCSVMTKRQAALLLLKPAQFVSRMFQPLKLTRGAREREFVYERGGSRLTVYPHRNGRSDRVAVASANDADRRQQFVRDALSARAARRGIIDVYVAITA